jgi:hypothetical protein
MDPEYLSIAPTVQNPATIFHSPYFRFGFYNFLAAWSSFEKHAKSHAKRTFLVNIMSGIGRD